MEYKQSWKCLWIILWLPFLESLPDISRWDTENINDMNSIFYKCSSLKLLPDISNWKTNSLKDIKICFLNAHHYNGWFLKISKTYSISKLFPNYFLTISTHFQYISKKKYLNNIYTSNWNQMQFQSISNLEIQIYTIPNFGNTEKYNSKIL